MKVDKIKHRDMIYVIEYSIISSMEFIFVIATNSHIDTPIKLNMQATDTTNSKTFHDFSLIQTINRNLEIKKSDSE